VAAKRLEIKEIMRPKIIRAPKRMAKVRTETGKEMIEPILGARKGVE